MSNEIENNLVEIKRIASAFRVDVCNGSIKFPFSEDFPSGCCGNASDLLRNILYKKGFRNVQYANGWKDEQSHGWLEYEGFIIDITANQFWNEEKNEIIIIAKDQSNFHKKFKPGWL